MNSIRNQSDQSSLLSRVWSLEFFLEIWVMLALTTVLIVWALPHTIAARNIALISGALAGLAWALKVRPQVHWKYYLPSLFLILVPVWVIFHWLFISKLPEPQWNEIDSTWLRVSIAIVLGSSAGLIVARKPNYLFFIIVGLIALPCMTAVLYLVQVYVQDRWVLDGFVGAFKGKFSGVYFIVCQVLLGFALLSYGIQNSNAKILRSFLFSFIGLILIAIGTLDFIALRALNGMLIISLSIFFLSIYLLIRFSFVASKNFKWFVLLAMQLVFIGVVFLGLFAFYQYDKKYEGKLTYLIGDIQITQKQLDTNPAWIRDGRSAALPTDMKGRPVNGSTYERVSWFIYGLRLIAQNPLGNGISHEAFGYYMREQFPNSKAFMTHSAWVDFTLGLGLPGLGLTCLAILSLAYLSITAKPRIPVADIQALGSQAMGTQAMGAQVIGIQSAALLPQITLWISMGMLFYWIIGEVSEREYIEHFFFLIALFGLALSNEKK